MIRFLISLAFLTCGVANAAIKKDSIGVENHNGKQYILHRVDPKETLFSLSRKYHVPVDDILSANPDAKEGLKIASVVKIPAKERLVTLPAGKKHIVQPSETLFSISKKYNVEIADLVAANKLADNNLKVGQEILIPVGQTSSNHKDHSTNRDPSKKYHTVSAGETLFSISKKYHVGVAQIKQWNSLSNNNLDLGQLLIVGEQDKSITSVGDNTQVINTQKQNTDHKEQTVSSKNSNNDNKTVASTSPVITEDIKKYKIEDNDYVKSKSTSSDQTKIEKVLESGFAELIVGSDDTKKYLALHKSAPVGTIMQVKNEMNDLSVFVRVIGKLPDTGENEKITIRLSKIAYDHLGAIDARFPVQISYIPR